MLDQNKLHHTNVDAIREGYRKTDDEIILICAVNYFIT